MKRLLSLLLVISMAFGLLCACEKPAEVYYEEPTDETTTAPTEPEPLIPPLEEGADILTFRYEEKYLDLYYEKLEEYKQHGINDTTMDALDALDPQMDELSTFLQDQQAIAMILYYCDMEDEEASQLHLDMTDMITEVQDATIMAMQEIYKSDSVIKDEIFADMTEEEIQALLDYNSDVKDIEQRYSEIVVEYQDMDDEQVEKEIGPLYAELVSNYNKMAQVYGYENYYDYAYEQENSRDYTGEEIQLMRTYAKKYLMPAYSAALENFYTGVQGLSSRQRERLLGFLEEDYDDVDYLEEYLDKLPEDMRNDLQTVFGGNSVFPKSRDAMPGAFTTVIGGEPFCFFSRDYRNTSTIVHEMGHYYGAIHGDLYLMPLDLAEVQSQAHEWLMIVAVEDELKDEVYECLLDYRMIEGMSTILMSLIIDEFEERVYNSEGVENFTTEDFDRIMEEVCEGYGGYDYVAENLADTKHYWRLVTLEHPLYYISYAVSLIPSIDMYFLADEDWDEALNVYLGLTRDLEEEPTFLGALEDAGLASPFDKDVYEAIADRYDIEVEEEVEEEAA